VQVQRPIPDGHSGLAPAPLKSQSPESQSPSLSHDTPSAMASCHQQAATSPGLLQHSTAPSAPTSPPGNRKSAVTKQTSPAMRHFDNFILNPSFWQPGESLNPSRLLFGLCRKYYFSNFNTKIPHFYTFF
jgi:hypothetical protein